MGIRSSVRADRLLGAVTANDYNDDDNDDEQNSTANSRYNDDPDLLFLLVWAAATGDGEESEQLTISGFSL